MVGRCPWEEMEDILEVADILEVLEDMRSGAAGGWSRWVGNIFVDEGGGLVGGV